MRKTLILSTAFLLIIVAGGFALGNQPAESILITGGLLVDGSGSAGRRVDVRIEGSTISEVGILKPRPFERVIDAKGRVVAPGFIDLHNHSESGLLRDQTARSQTLQGITTLAVGPDGSSPFPIADYFERIEKSGAAVNVLSFVGHATLRRRVMGDDYKRSASDNEIRRMAEMVDQAMREGAIGLSTGLEYDLGHPSTTEEVIALARIAAKYKGIYISHVRDEADLAMDAFREAIRIGREAGLPIQISHIKLGTVGVWGKADEVVGLIDDARRKGVDVTADCYPYDAWASTITVLVPSRKHDDPAAVTRGLQDVGGGKNVLIASCSAHPEFVGKTLDEIAASSGASPVEVYMRIVKDGGAGVVCRSMTESDIRTFYRQPWVMVASDGGIGMRHPRGTGTYPRVLGRFARDWKWISLEEAIRKMTSLPASRAGLRDRGIIKKGMKADLVIFDQAQVIDRSTMTQPFVEPIGMDYVLVNGVAVIDGGKTTGMRPGIIVRHISR